MDQPMNDDEFDVERRDPAVIGFAENEQKQQVFIIVAPGSTINWERICLIETFDPQRVIVATPVETIRGIGRGPAAKTYLDTVVSEACAVAEEHFDRAEDPWTRFINIDKETDNDN